MGNFKKRLRHKLVNESSIIRIFGSSNEHNEEIVFRRKMRQRQNRQPRKPAQTKSEQSVRAISTPFGGMNKRY